MQGVRGSVEPCRMSNGSGVEGCKGRCRMSNQAVIYERKRWCGIQRLMHYAKGRFILPLSSQAHAETQQLQLFCVTLPANHPVHTHSHPSTPLLLPAGPCSRHRTARSSCGTTQPLRLLTASPCCRTPVNRGGQASSSSSSVHEQRQEGGMSWPLRPQRVSPCCTTPVNRGRRSGSSWIRGQRPRKGDALSESVPLSQSSCVQRQTGSSSSSWISKQRQREGTG